MATWRERHYEQWSARGVGPSANGYAYVVAEQRLGKRKTLAFDTSLRFGSVTDRAARQQVRAQVDAVLDDEPQPPESKPVDLDEVLGLLAALRGRAPITAAKLARADEILDGWSCEARS